MKELDEFMDRVMKLIDIWDNPDVQQIGKTNCCITDRLQVAKDLNLTLTVIKLMVRPSEFDQLPAFKRYLNETSEYINPKKEGA